MPGNGNHRSETVAEYLKEAERCEQFASHSKDADRQHWLDLAERFRKLARQMELGGGN